MPCYQKESDKLGGKVWLCGELGSHCAECDWVSDYLCDYPVGDGKTCDRPLCEDHANEVAPNLHYCSAHLAMWNEFRDSGGVKLVLENVTPFRKKT